MQVLTYNTKLQFKSQEDKDKLLRTLELERDIFNFCSKKHFGAKKNSIVDLHAKCYYPAREQFPQAKAQLIIKAQKSCLSAYKSIKTNKHKISKPIRKCKLSTDYDNKMFLYKDGIFSLTVLGTGRIQAYPILYDKIKEISLYAKLCDPKIFVRGDDIYISMIFKFEVPAVPSKLALGVDLGIRRFAATSEGNIFQDKKFLKEKRKLRYLKSQLKSKGTKTAKKHLKQLRRKEANRNRNFNHHLANAILKTKADTIVLEDINVNKLKGKKHRYQNKNRISQVAFAAVKDMLTYKANLQRKQVITVNPAFTSQDDSVTGKRDGIRKGCRYYAKSGLVYDADVNAAVNIARKANLPISQSNLLDGQATVNRPLGSQCGN